MYICRIRNDYVIATSFLYALWNVNLLSTGKDSSSFYAVWHHILCNKYKHYRNICLVHCLSPLEYKFFKIINIFFVVQSYNSQFLE